MDIQNAQGGTGNTTTEENHNLPSFERKEIEGTPFTAVKVDDKGWFLAIGLQRFTEPVETEEELLEIVNRPDWNLITEVTIFTVRQTLKLIEAEKAAKNIEGETNNE